MCQKIQHILLLRDRRNFTFSPAATPALHRGRTGSVVDLVRRKRFDQVDLTQTAELVGARRHQGLLDLRVDEDGHREAIPTGSARVNHPVRDRGDLAERVHLQHVTRIDDDRSGRVVGVKPLIVAGLHLESRLIRRDQQGDEVDVLMCTRTGHFGIRAIERRVVNDTKQVLALGDPIQEEVRITPQMHGESLEHHSTRTSLERRVELQSRGTELGHLDRELVAHDGRRVVDMPEGHAVSPRLPHRDLGVSGRETHLVPLEGELVLEPLLQGHAREEDLARELKAPRDEALGHAVSHDGDEAMLPEGLPEGIGDFHVFGFVFTEARHVENGNTAQGDYPFDRVEIFPRRNA